MELNSGATEAVGWSTLSTGSNSSQTAPPPGHAPRGRWRSWPGKAPRELRGAQGGITPGPIAAPDRRGIGKNGRGPAGLSLGWPASRRPRPGPPAAAAPAPDTGRCRPASPRPPPAPGQRTAHTPASGVLLITPPPAPGRTERAPGPLTAPRRGRGPRRPWRYQAGGHHGRRSSPEEGISVRFQLR